MILVRLTSWVGAHIGHCGGHFGTLTSFSLMLDELGKLEQESWLRRIKKMNHSIFIHWQINLLVKKRKQHRSRWINESGICMKSPQNLNRKKSIVSFLLIEAQAPLYAMWAQYFTNQSDLISFRFSNFETSTHRLACSIDKRQLETYSSSSAFCKICWKNANDLYTSHTLSVY